MLSCSWRCITGNKLLKQDQTLALTADSAYMAQKIISITLRDDDTIGIGDVAEPYRTNLDSLVNSRITKLMRRPCLPRLVHARLDPTYPLIQCLQPFRQRGVRIAEEPWLWATKNDKAHHSCSPVSGRLLMHRQGRSGWRLCFGCAGDVAKWVGKEALMDLMLIVIGTEGTFVK